MKQHRPRVAWDMTFTVRSVTGTHVYTRNLYDAIARAGEFELCELYATQEKGPKRRGTLRANARNIQWLLFDAERELKRVPPVLFHAAAFFGPRRVPCPIIVNVFDITYLTFPREFDWKWQTYARTAIPHTIKNAAAVLTLSKHARGEIVRAYHIPQERVHIVPPGIGAEFRPTTEGEALAALRAKYNLAADYMLYVGGRNPRKNLPVLVEAFGLTRREFPELQFAIAGPRGHHKSSDDAIANAALAPFIRELDYVPQADLPLLYAGARVSVFASKLEGFGMPPVEAMASGTPVVSAPHSPMPEVLGDAALFTPDDSPAALATGILRVLKDHDLAQSLRARGLERARLYSWDESAHKTMDIYREVLAQTRGVKHD